MSTNVNEHDRSFENANPGQANGGTHSQDFEKLTQGMSHEEKQRAVHAGRFGYGPLAHMRTNDTSLLPGTLLTKPSSQYFVR